MNHNTVDFQALVISSSLTVEALRAEVKRYGVTVGDRITVGPLQGWRPVFFVSHDWVHHKLFPPNTPLAVVSDRIEKTLKDFGVITVEVGS